MLRHKEYLATKIDVDEEERTITATISTGSVDRDNEVLLPKGGNFENFLKNPVVLWSHDYFEPPIAKALWVKQSGNKIIAKAQFAETEKAIEIYKLFKGGFLNAFSIGFDPDMDVASRPTPDEIRKNPDLADAWRIFRKWELLEFSAVAVPANPEALAIAIKTKDISVAQDVLDDIDLAKKETEKTFTPETKDVLDENSYHFSEDGTTCVIVNGDGESKTYILKGTSEDETETENTIEVELDVQKIIDVKPAPVEVEKYIEVQSVANISAIERKRRGVMYEQ